MCGMQLTCYDSLLKLQRCAAPKLLIGLMLCMYLSLEFLEQKVY